MLHEKLEAFQRRRNAAPDLPQGSGPYTSSSHFKAPPLGQRSYARSWDHRFSAEALSQFASELKLASRGSGPSGRKPKISLGTGRPATQYFPWNSLTMNVTCSRPSNDVGGALSAICTKGEKEYDLDIAMNYRFSAGSPQTLRYITEYVELTHNED